MKAKPVQTPKEQMFITWKEGDEQGKALAMAQSYYGTTRTEPIIRTHGSNLYQNISPQNVSVRDGMDRADYDTFRPESALPYKPKDIIRACMEAYRSVGLIKNVVDLMSEFGCKGIKLVHPNEKIENFYKEWFRKIGGKDRSERFLNMLYRTGNVIVKRQTAKIPVALEEQMKSSSSPADLTIEKEEKLQYREIPWKFIFLNPLAILPVAEELASFVGVDNVAYAIAIPPALSSKVKNPKGQVEQDLIDKIPDDVLQAIQIGAKTFPLDPKKVRSFHYKRDDWEIWAKPMIHAILSDIQVLNKLKLSDLAALDGAISCIRVWKLGDIKERILPTASAMNRLAEMLCNNVGGGVMDLVWGPDISLVETSTDVHKFLGQSKYEPTLTAIYAGLGIPPTLTGASTASGFTNNYISLQTLVERLEYGRDKLREFWEEEVRLVQKALGFRLPAQIVFDNMNLTDEHSRLKLLMDLADRDLVDIETLHDMFGLEPDVVQQRLRREDKKRKRKTMLAPAGPFHTADQDFELKKAFIPTKIVTPSEVGLDLEEKDSGQKNPLELEAKFAPKPVAGSKPKGQPGQGRPKGKKDTTKRKQKKVNVRTSASFIEAFSWAEQTQAKIGNITSPAYLKAIAKKNMRELTEVETKNFENFKFYTLCQLELYQEVNEEVIQQISANQLSIPEHVSELLKATIQKHIKKTGKEPITEVLRQYQAGAFSLWKGNFSDETSNIDDSI